MKQVILLTPDEWKRSEFMENLMSVQRLDLCMVHIPTKIYTYQVFGLLTDDRKLSEYIKTRDGIIIMLNYHNMGDEVMRRIRDVVKGSPNTPILYVVEKYSWSLPKIDPLKKLYRYTTQDHQKVFLLDYGKDGARGRYEPLQHRQVGKFLLKSIIV